MAESVKRLAVLGSTGSIGRQTLEVVRAFPGRFQVVALAAGRNIALLAQQIDEFHPQMVYYARADGDESPRLNGCQWLTLEDIAAHPLVDTVVMATSGRAGLGPTLAAVRAGKAVALANKEALVMAGEFVMAEARQHHAPLLPVDSEHSAIWQCLAGERREGFRIVLTASGGPFRGYTPAQLADVTVEQALAHPSWRMGRKVTVDSATLMNKGLEVIEAHWLFHLPVDDIRVMIHPQSIIHSLVEFADGSVKAQLSYPDMRLPIQYALCYPQRLPNPKLPRLDWGSLSSLDFEPPDESLFPCLRLAAEAGKKGGTYPAVLCAADEAAVELFLSRRIGFGDIARLVERVLGRHRAIARPALEEILVADAWAREETLSLASGSRRC